jgi:hypothetical protein
MELKLNNNPNIIKRTILYYNEHSKICSKGGCSCPAGSFPNPNGGNCLSRMVNFNLKK